MLHELMAPERALPWIALAFAVGYLAGSIPFGLLVSRALGHGDPRRVGSGNIGATNVMRTGGKAAAVFTFALDFLKGLIPVLWFLGWGDLTAQAAGLGAFAGHCLPVWLRFKGGKGVSTWFGIVFALHWPAGLVLAAVWLGVQRLTKISAAGALAASLAGPLVFIGFARHEAVLAMALLAILVWLTHLSNLRRLISGRENRF
ncbi:MAG: glycerol-3-phosphate 1-O-acyltransferase PlsY [Pseudomonadota bacterium]